MAEGDRVSNEAFLSGQRVMLRPLERADLPRYQELFSEPEINLFYGGLGVSENLARLQRRYDAGDYDTTDRFLILVIEAEGTLIGASTLHLDYAFGVLGYHKFNLDLFEYNARALAMYEKLGFVIEGRRRENYWSRGRFWDDNLMGVTIEEWWSKHGPSPQPGSGPAPR